MWKNVQFSTSQDVPGSSFTFISLVILVEGIIRRHQHLSPCFCTLYSNNSPLLITIRDYITTRCNNRLAYLVITGCTIVVQVIWLMIKVSLFVSAKTQLKIKERQILSKMHFKPQGSSAVVELHKLTDYISGHLFEEQFHFHFIQLSLSFA